MDTVFAESESDAKAFVAAVLQIGEKRSQIEIAHLLDVSPMKVSRLLEDAKRNGYITPATLNYAVDRNLSLVADLTKDLRLREVIIALTRPEMTEQTHIDAVASMAARYWENFKPSSLKQRRIKAGLSGGRAIARTVELVQLPEIYGYDCYSLANIPSGDWQVSADTNLAVLKRRFRGEIKSASRQRGHKNGHGQREGKSINKLHVDIHPLGAMQLSEEMTDEQILDVRKKLLSLRRVTQLFQEFSECELVFTGIGSTEDHNLLRLIKAIGVNSIPENVTGDVGYNFVRHAPEVFCDHDNLGSRLISVPMKTLQKVALRTETRVVAVAWGRKKAKPLIDAVVGGLVNAAVIDSELADEANKLIKQGYHREFSKESGSPNGVFPVQSNRILRQ